MKVVGLEVWVVRVLEVEKVQEVQEVVADRVVLPVVLRARSLLRRLPWTTRTLLPAAPPLALDVSPNHQSTPFRSRCQRRL